jgi:hypothetical protein
MENMAFHPHLQTAMTSGGRRTTMDRQACYMLRCGENGPRPSSTSVVG